jgi:hypothetical protein
VSLAGLPTLSEAGAANLVPFEASRQLSSAARKYRIPQELLNRSYKPTTWPWHVAWNARGGVVCLQRTWLSLPNRTAIAADATLLVAIPVGSQ